MTTIESLCERLRIRDIYWIDDENASQAELDIDKLGHLLATTLTESSPEERKRAFEVAKRSSNLFFNALQKANSKKPEEHEHEFLSSIQKINDFGIDDPKILFTGMLDVLPRPLAPHHKQALSEIFSTVADCTWHSMSFTQWGIDKDRILRDHIKKRSPALLLVDLQNTREASSLGGNEVLQHWAQRVGSKSRKTPACIYAIALTSKFGKASEFIEGRRFTNDLFQHSTPSRAAPVLAISKERFTVNADNGSPETELSSAFSDALARLRAFGLHIQLANKLQGIFLGAVGTAFSALQELSMEELLYSISARSIHEGAGDIDTLLRMAGVAHRAALLNDIKNNRRILLPLLELRGLQDLEALKIAKKDIDSSDKIDELRRHECHDPIEVVNGLLSPISTGDVFEFESHHGKEYAVLISNACDLTLRGRTGDRKLKKGLFAIIEDLPSKPPANIHPINPFPLTSPLANRSIGVNLNHIRTVSLDILDLAWTSHKGQCSWEAGGHALNNLKMLPGQRLRYENLTKVWENVASQEQLASLSDGIVFDARFTIVPTLEKLNFSARRIGRISSTFAAELNAKFAFHTGRPSMLHDYSI